MAYRKTFLLNIRTALIIPDRCGPGGVISRTLQIRKPRQWWKDQFKEYINIGIHGFWNDMNEIATWGNMLPENMEMDFEGKKSVDAPRTKYLWLSNGTQHL